MRKLFKVIVVLFALIIFLSLGIFATKKLFPDYFQTLEDKARIFLVHKITLLANSLAPKNTLEQKKQNSIEQKIPQLEEEIDYFTNQDIYKALCEDEKHENSKDKFLGCHRCPKYLDSHSSDYFNLRSFAQGAIIKKGENEAIFFMHGCLEDENTIAIVLRKNFGGWHRVSQFKNIAFDEPPLVFKDVQGFLILIGKRKIMNEITNKETLFALTFKNNKLHSQDIFSIRFASGLKCSYQFLAGMDTPTLISEHKFSIRLDVMGWQDIANSDCKFPSKNINVSLKPDVYTLHFTQKEDSFIGDKATQKIITELEKAQE